jgi:hypothetical protein
MPRRVRIDVKQVCLATMLAAVIMPHMAAAALGQPETSAAADAQVLKGSIKSIDQVNYRVHTIELPSGTVLREFATVGGSVFAIAWSGPSMPNLRQSLGQYFDGYVAAAKARPGSHHQLVIQQDDWVVQSSGHMRAFTGRVYLPHEIPASVSLDELH